MQAGRRLYDLVFAPILRALDPAVRDLILVPSSDLAGVPFEALVLPDAAAAPASFAQVPFVLDRYTLAYAPSAAVFLELADDDRAAREPRALILADPRYAAAAATERDGTLVLSSCVPVVVVFARVSLP